MSSGQHWRDKLTPSEAEVVELVAEGLTTKQIADVICIAPSTVKMHIGNAKRKIGNLGNGRVSLAKWWWNNVDLPAILKEHDESK